MAGCRALDCVCGEALHGCPERPFPDGKGPLARTFWRLCRSSPVRLVLFSLLIWLCVACLTVFLCRKSVARSSARPRPMHLGVRPCSRPGWRAPPACSVDLEHLAQSLPGEARQGMPSVLGLAWFASWACAPACFPRSPGFRILMPGNAALRIKGGVSRAKLSPIAAISKPLPTAVAVDCFFPKCKTTACQGPGPPMSLRRRATTPGPCCRCRGRAGRSGLPGAMVR